MKRFVLVAIILTTAAIVYFWLGGPEELEFELVEKQFHLAGEKIRDRYSNSSLETAFFNARDLALADRSTLLTVVNYEDQAEDTVTQFIGVTGSLNEFKKQGFDQWTGVQYNGSYLSCAINVHNLVMPTPQEVLEAAQPYALQFNVKVDSSYTIEQYVNERLLRVYIPVKD